MKQWIMALGALAVVGSACSSVVLDPVQGKQNTSTVGGTSRGNVLAMRAGDVILGMNESFELTIGSPPWAKPDSLALFFSGDVQQCSDPVHKSTCTGITPSWQTILVIPPELARPGLLDLRDPRISQFYDIPGTFNDGAPQLCRGFRWQRGEGRQGTLELISSGPTSLTVKIRDSSTPMGPEDTYVDPITHTVNVHGGTNLSGALDGDYTATLCGAPPVNSPPAPALAIRGAALPPEPGGTSSVDGATPDPDRLFVFLGDTTNTCQDPWSSFECSKGASRLAIGLPLALQKPGVISLDDLSLDLIVTIAGNPGTYDCISDHEIFAGTLEILSSDANGLTFKISGSGPTDHWGVMYDFNGLYHASICP